MSDFKFATYIRIPTSKRNIAFSITRIRKIKEDSYLVFEEINDYLEESKCGIYNYWRNGITFTLCSFVQLTK